MKWNRIDEEEEPTQNQKVWYWFEPFKQISLGTYTSFFCEDLGCEVDQFSNKSGFLTDDVTFWLPYIDDTKPKAPSISQRKKCLYHPFKNGDKK